MELFVSAGEASSDIHCAHLLSELKKQAGESVTAFGLGGDRLRAEGVDLLMHNRDFSVMGGPLEVVSKLPRRRRLEGMLEKRLFEKRPDGAILVDNGEINLRLASLLHFFDVPVVYFIPPKVWVWRHARIEDIAHHVSLVLSILPFEEPLYKEWNVPFRYVGNPLVDEVPAERREADAKRALGLAPERVALAVFPGSRHSEIRHHVELFSGALALFLGRLPPSEKRPEILIPIAPSLDAEAVRLAFGNRVPGARFVRGASADGRVSDSHLCLAAARAALVKSGTSTLEAALLGVPHVLAYRSSRSSEWIYRYVVRYRGFVGMVNLFLCKPAESALGWGPPVGPVVPELILDKAKPEEVAEALHRVYVEGPERAEMLRRLAGARAMLAPPAELGTSPLGAAARAALETIQGRRRDAV